MGNLILNRRGYQKIEFVIRRKESSTSSWEYFDLTDTISTWTMSNINGGEPLIEKSSTSEQQIAHTLPLSGKLEVYITAEDTDPISPGKYWYTLYNINSLGQTFNLQTDWFKLIDAVQQADKDYTT